MDYVIAGNVMLDTVRFADGTTSAREHIGGPATFAYSGVKLWTDNVIQCSYVGEDYHPLFDPWVEKNNIDTRAIKVRCDHCNHSFLLYREDGTYGPDPEAKHFRSDWMQDFGHMKSSPDDIGEFTKGGGTKGVYIAQNVDYVYWRKMKEIKARDGFKLMWEIEGPSSYKEFMPAVLNAMESTDIFSINIQEARNLFEVETEEEVIKELQKCPVDLTLFRVGKKGLYSVTPTEVYFLPSAPVDKEIDPTGCGNTSTGSALYAYAEGYDALMVGIMANVASAQNIRQYGIIPDFMAVRDFAYNQANELYEEFKNK